MATVNGKDILRSELEKYYKANLGDNAQQPSPEQADIVRLNILNQMIDDEILWQRAAKLNLAASDEDVNAKLTEMKAPYTQEEFDKQLQARNITLDDFKRELRRQLTKTKLLNKEIESKINITDAEIGSYYAAHKSEFNLIEPQYHLAQIAVTSGPAQQTGNLQNNKASGDADAKKKIQELHKRLEAGEDFGAVAMNFSENPNTAANGGDMGFIPESPVAQRSGGLQRHQQAQAGRDHRCSSRLQRSRPRPPDHRLRNLQADRAGAGRAARVERPARAAGHPPAASARATRNCSRTPTSRCSATRPRFTTTLPTRSSSRARNKARRLTGFYSWMETSLP